MAKGFRFWHKKRGARRTSSNLVGSVGEAIFFGVLFLLGVVSLASLLMSRITEDPTAAFAPGFGFWLMVTVLGSFVLIGGGGAIYTVLHVGTSAERRSALAKRAVNIELLSDAVPTPRDFPTLPSDNDLINSPGIQLAYRLPAAQSPVWRLAAATVFCLVWNLLTAALTVVAAKSRPATFGEGLLTWASVAPFLVVAVWSINHFIRELLLCTGIGPTIVEVSEHPLFPGHTYQVFVSQVGRLKINLFEMFLVCEEEATYHQGTDIRTDKCVVHEQLVFRRENFAIDNGTPYEYQCVFSIPEQAMHSFQSPHNRITWKLVAKGNAATWPTFVRSFPVLVYPTKAATPSPPQTETANQMSV